MSSIRAESYLLSRCRIFSCEDKRAGAGSPRITYTYIHQLVSLTVFVADHGAQLQEKKGSHGGKRAGAGLQPHYWEEQGGRAVAAAAKAARKEEAARKVAAKKERMAGFWAAVGVKQQQENEECYKAGSRGRR